MTDKNNETKVFGEYDASVVSSEARAYTMTTTDDEGAYYEPPSYSDVSETTTTTDDTDYDSGLVRSIDINPWRKDMKVRETFRFTANVYPENAANKAVYWNTGNSNVATVDSFGNVTATGEGHTFVFATAKDGSGVTGNAAVYVTSDDTGEYPEPDPNPDIGGTTSTTDNSGEYPEVTPGIDIGTTTTTTSSTVCYPYVDIPQTGDIGTSILYMGYHMITSPSSNQYKLKIHAQNSGRYSYSYPEYFAQIDGRILIATKPNIGNQLPLSIGDYVQVSFKTNSGEILNFDCIIGDFKGSDAPNIWGHRDGRNVVEVIYHNYSPPDGYSPNKNNPWGSGRVVRVSKVGNYGNFN